MTRDELLNNISGNSVYLRDSDGDIISRSLCEKDLYDILGSNTRKQSNCPYCHKPFKEISNENIEATIVFNSKKVSLRMMDSEFYEDNVTIIYCPMCGRELGDDE